MVGSKGDAVVRALASHQCGPGSTRGIDAICGLSLILVLSLAPRGFSPGTPVFPSPQKPTFPNSNLTRNQVDEPLCGCATCKLLFIYLLYSGILSLPLLSTLTSSELSHNKCYALWPSMAALTQHDWIVVSLTNEKQTKWNIWIHDLKYNYSIITG